jgi:hypothetical protein
MHYEVLRNSINWYKGQTQDTPQDFPVKLDLAEQIFGVWVGFIWSRIGAPL